MAMKKGGAKKVSGGGPRKARPGAGGAAKARSNAASGVNPFDVRSNAKTKYEVLGRRVKGQGRNVAVARADAEAKRKKTLSAQFKARHKANAFKDRRLGEGDASMTLEDKMMARFQTERKRKMRNGSAFALQDSDDDDDDELFLTHRGQKIDDYDRLNAGGDGAAFDDDAEDDDEGRAMDREIVERLHFGGGGGATAAADVSGSGGPEKKKSHKEIMQEVMQKAKLFKAERQKNKAAQEDSTDALDSEFASLKGLLSFRPTKGSQEAAALEKEERVKAPLDEFDKLTRELTFEAKAHATERRMSPEEAAARERDRLEELERKRVARMNGEDSDDEDAGKRGKKAKAKVPQMIIMPPTDDDLATDYQVDQQFGGAIEEEGDEACADDADGDDDEDEAGEEGGSSDEEAGSDEEDGDEEGDGEGEDDEEEEQDEEREEEEGEGDDDDNDAAKKAERKRKRQEAAAELPFVFPCPESPEELTALFRDHAHQSSQRRALVIERIVTFYSPRLSADNQRKMKTFFAILVRQFLKWGKQYAVYKQDLDAVAKHMFTIAQELPDTAAVVARELLINLHKRLHSSKSASRWPQLAELLLCKALIHIFPTSDLRHNVVSPMETLLSEALGVGAIDSPAEATQALFTCTLVLQMTRDKQRFTPEVLVCVKKILRLLLTDGSHWLRRDLLAWREGKADDVSLPSLSLAEASSPSAAAVLGALLGVVEVVATQYASLPSFDELVHPVYLLLHEVTRAYFHGRSPRVNEVIARLHQQLENCWSARTPLRLQTFGPAVLPSFAPKFDANYTLRKDKTLDREKAKTKQLQRQVKRARKGAARELRRDAEFLAREKQQEETVRVADKRDKQKEIWRWLEEQNATFNEQAKKGGNMLKGGGSGPAKKRRTPRQ